MLILPPSQSNSPAKPLILASKSALLSYSSPELLGTAEFLFALVDRRLASSPRVLGKPGREM
jgi:hypothetical protein